MSKHTANIILLLISIFWGSGFIATKMALDANVTAGFINFIRGTIIMIGLALMEMDFKQLITKKNGTLTNDSTV